MHRSKTELDGAFMDHFAAHLNRMRRETQPDDPPVLAEEMTAQTRNLPPVVDLEVWSVEDGENVVAHARLQLLNLDTNRHLAQLDLMVEPEFRRQGLGSALLRQAAEYAQAQGRRLLIVSSTDRVPAGEPFLERAGLTRGLETRTNQLRISDLPAGLLDAWTTRPPDGYVLEIWDGAVPEADLAGYAELLNVMNSAPKDNLEIEDEHVTPELVRQLEEMRRASGREVLVAVVRSPAGQLVGLSELSWRPRAPETVNQGDTGVHADHRGHALGRWLKAANVQRVLAVNPQAQMIRTGNANSNAPMLKINTEMGFRPYTAHTVWQGELATVLDRTKE